MKTMTTYQDYGKWQGAAVTTWNYHPQRGWLLNKRYADGNLIRDDQWLYTWDAENRLIAMQSSPDTAPGQQQRLKFTYDFLGRRISKKVYDRKGNQWSLTTDLRFVYDGWNLLAELTSDLRPLTSYVWGLDLSGSTQGAGGVGGLLLISDHRSPTSSHYTK